MSPLRSAPLEVVAEPLVPPAVAPPMSYHRHKAGIAGVQVAPSGNSKCRACDSRIAYKSVCFEYWWNKSRPPGYVHLECVVRLVDEEATELCHDLDFLHPENDNLIAAISVAKAALQGRR